MPSTTANFLPISRASLTLRPTDPSRDASSTSDFSARVSCLNDGIFAGGRRSGNRDSKARIERSKGWLISGVEVDVSVCCEFAPSSGPDEGAGVVRYESGRESK